MSASGALWLKSDAPHALWMTVSHTVVGDEGGVMVMQNRDWDEEKMIKKKLINKQQRRKHKKKKFNVN